MDAALDIEQPGALLRYLRAQGQIGPEEAPSLRTLEGGVSNRTVLVERPGGEAWVLKQALEKLRVATDWHSSPQRIHREALGMRWLGTLAPAGTVPALVFEDHEQHLLAMTAIPQPHENWKVRLLAGGISDKHSAQFGHLLGTIHRRSHEQRGEAAPLFDDRSFFDSLRLEPYYRYSAEQCPAAAGFLSGLITETQGQRHALVHGDYSPKNILIFADRLILLDHEVIHWGDPAFDLGFSLTHLLSKAHFLRSRREAFAGAALRYWQAYGEALGAVPWAAGLEQRAVRHTLACCLARVAGRSPLEYLDADQRARQRDAALALMAAPPATIAGTISDFLGRIGRSEHAGD